MHFMAKSCLHVVINYLWLPEPDQNMPYLSPYQRSLENPAKFRRNGKITRIGSKFRIPWKAVIPICNTVSTKQNTCILVQQLDQMQVKNIEKYQ